MDGERATNKESTSRRWEQAFVYPTSYLSEGKNSKCFSMSLLFFITPMQGNLHINKFRSPISSFWFNSYAKGVCVCVSVSEFVPFCEHAHVVYCCSNSWRHLSCWLCTIKGDCFFFPLRCFLTSQCCLWDVQYHCRLHVIHSNHIPFRSWNYIPQVVRACHKFALCNRGAIKEERDLVLQNKKAVWRGNLLKVCFLVNM